MQRVMVMLCAVGMLACLSSAAVAEGDYPSSTTLQEMGLSGLEVMSDSEAMAVRGKGFLDPGERPRLLGLAPGNIAFGASFATIGDEHGDSGTIDAYLSVGRYAAGGEHFSKATKTQRHTEIVRIDGSVKAVTKIWSKSVSAGGFANSWSL